MFADDAFCVGASASYVFLFFVLTVYKYEVMFRTCVILVALLGYFLPFLYVIPYVFVALRVFVGMNVETDQKLYIARVKDYKDMDKADFSGSTTLSHWAVVIQDVDRYIYTHAVGNVISGEGEKIRFKEMKNKDKYILHPVGFVTRKRRDEKMSELVDGEVMASGNSCQEYAVDIAFQLSSSRTYTFVKMMTLPRLRNTVFYVSILLSIVLKVFNYTYAGLLNPLIVANVFCAWELSRIGIHNEMQKFNFRYMVSVIRAYITYPTTANIYSLLLICVMLVYLYQRLGIEECIILSCLLAVIAFMRLR